MSSIKFAYVETSNMDSFSMSNCVLSKIGRCLAHVCEEICFLHSSGMS